jgi:hypothetical protein
VLELDSSAPVISIQIVRGIAVSIFAVPKFPFGIFERSLYPQHPSIRELGYDLSTSGQLLVREFLSKALPGARIVEF